MPKNKKIYQSWLTSGPTVIPRQLQIPEIIYRRTRESKSPKRKKCVGKIQNGNRSFTNAGKIQ